MKLTRNLFIPMLDTDHMVPDAEPTGTPVYVPIDLSTVFEFAFNPNTETYTYICYANDTTETTGYAPTMEQEIVLDNENPLYKAMYPFMMSMPTGSKCKVPCLMVEPDMETGEPTRGRLWPDATVSPGTVNTVDGKLTFTLNFNGEAVEGSVSKTDGKVAFTPDSDDADVDGGTE